MRLIPLQVAVCFVVASATTFAQKQKSLPAKTKSVQSKAKAKPSTAKPKSKTAKQKSKTPKKKAAAKSTSPAADAKAWDALNVRRRKIGRELREMKIEFSISSRQRKMEIKTTFDTRLKEWQDEIRPKMVELSVAKLETDPDNEFAGRLSQETANFRKAAEVTERILKAGKKTGPVLYLAGLMQFNLNNFDRALKLLEQARDKNAGVEQGLLDLAKDYVKHEKREAELRAKEDKAAGDKKLPTVEFETARGKFTVVLFENEAPNTVANFISLIERKTDGTGYFDGQHFHNVMSSFWAGAGDPTTKPAFDPKQRYGFAGPGYTIKCECKKEGARVHFRGSLSMDHRGQDTGGSQFLISMRPMPGRNVQPSGIGGYTVFGRVIGNGMDIVEKIKKGDKIIAVKVLEKRKHAYKPFTSADEEAAKKKIKDKKPMKKETKSKPGKTESKKPQPKKTATKKPAGKTPPKKTGTKTPADKTPAKSATKTKTPAKTGQ